VLFANPALKKGYFMSEPNFETALGFQVLTILKTIDSYHSRSASQVAELGKLPIDAVRTNLRMMEKVGWIESIIKDGAERNDSRIIDTPRPPFPSVPWRRVYQLTENGRRILANNPIPPRPADPTSWQKFVRWLDTPPGTSMR
jgi:DNA-binding PadR family transcriptional regulator